MDDLSVSLVVRSILDGRGFEDAQTKLRGLAGAANEAAPKMRQAGHEAEKMGDELGGTRGPVAHLTHLLFQQAGMTEQAGFAARFLGEATYATAGSVSMLALSAGGLVLAASFIIPKLVEWFNKTKEVSEEQEKLRQEIIADLPRLQELADQTHHVSEALERQLAATRSLALEAQQEHIDKLNEEIKAIREQLPLENIIVQKRLNHAEALEALNTLEQEHGETLTAEQKKQEQLKIVLAQKLALREREIAAQKEGLTLAEYDEKHGTAAKKKDDDAAAAAKRALAAKLESIRLTNASNDALEEEARLGRKFAADQEKDAEKDMAADTARKYKKVHDDLAADNEYQTAYAAMKRQQEQIDRETAAARQELELSVASSLMGSLSALFGNNKSLAIAAALIDTYAGANKALAQGGYIGIAMAAAVVVAGLANVKKIRDSKPGVGFDDPFSDQVARSLGRTSATDFVKYFGEMFIPGVRQGMRGMMMAGAAGGSSYHIDRSTHHHWGGIHGVIASDKTGFMRWLDRTQSDTDRYVARTTVGSQQR